MNKEHFIYIYIYQGVMVNSLNYNFHFIKFVFFYILLHNMKVYII